MGTQFSLRLLVWRPKSTYLQQLLWSHLLLKDWLFLVINTTVELPLLPLEGALGIRVPLVDSPSEDLLPHLSRVASLISDEIEAGGNVLIHCVAGVSRSASFILAYLISSYNLTLQQALCHLKIVRPWVNPNKGFLSQLRSWEEQQNRSH